ncbi:MAG: response regulator [Chloroflexi bacterium]|nr:response regulator [Chloroflexota bacterium]
MRRVLIVEDAQELGRLLQAALKTLPFPIESVIVPSAEEAMLDARQHPPDLLVTDIRLPGMSGLDLIQKLRDRLPQTRYVVITALAEDEHRIRARKMGVRAYFQKPMELADFLAAVTAALEVSESEFESEAPRGVEKPLHPPQHVFSISEWLSNLCAGLKAQAVLVLDDHGRITGQAGDFPAADVEQRWIPAMMAANSSHHRLAHMLGEAHPHSLQVFAGREFDLFLAPVGDYALVLVFGVGSAASFTAQVYGKILEAQLALVESFRQVGAHFQQEEPSASAPAAEEAGEAPGEDNLSALEALLANSGESLQVQDADAFWQNTNGKPSSGGVTLPGAISYEQAWQLGLIPKDAQED